MCSFCSDAETVYSEFDTIEQLDSVVEELLSLRTQFHDQARNNVQTAQQRQKEYYDSRHDSHHVS